VTIFLVGICLLVVGALLNAAGWSLHKRGIRGDPTEQFYAWFLEQVKQLFPLMTGRDSSTGERLAAFGALIAGLGLLVAVVGLVSWAVG